VDVVQKNAAHPDQAAVLDRATVQDAAVPDADVGATVHGTPSST